MVTGNSKEEVLEVFEEVLEKFGMNSQGLT